jgi:hypothetical protein
MKQAIIGLLAILFSLGSTFGEASKVTYSIPIKEEQMNEETFGEASNVTYSIQLFKIGNAPSIMSMNKPNSLVELLSSPEVTIQSCGVFDMDVGATAVFTSSFEYKQSSFIMKLIKAESNIATIEVTCSHQYPKETENISINNDRSVAANNYIVESREPATITLSYGGWVTLGGDPFSNTEIMILRIVK